MPVFAGSTAASSRLVSVVVSRRDPFVVLGLDPGASLADVRDARRRLAKHVHPDRGGTVEEMSAINDAVDRAIAAIAARSGRSRPSRANGPSAARSRRRFGPSAIEYDQPSFVVEALPAVAYEALLLAVVGLGDLVDDDPPYRMAVQLHEPHPCLCEIDLLPEAGATTVGLAIAATSGPLMVAVETVRDLVIAELNRLDWDDLTR